MHNKQMEAGLSHLEYSYTKTKIMTLMNSKPGFLWWDSYQLMNTLPSPSEVREI